LASRARVPALVLWALVVGVAAAAWAEPPAVEEDYVLQCSACHGADGRGVAERVPSLEHTGLLAQRPGGRAYLMRVPGAAQAPISDERLARLLTWVVARYGGVVLDPPFDAVEVGRARKRPLRDPAAERQHVLADAPVTGEPT
jgi:mono/diheme cytochrome c family protein